MRPLGETQFSYLGQMPRDQDLYNVTIPDFSEELESDEKGSEWE